MSKINLGSDFQNVPTGQKFDRNYSRDTFRGPNWLCVVNTLEFQIDELYILRSLGQIEPS